MTTSSEHGPGRPGSSWERLVAALEAAGLDYTTTRGGHHIKAICPAHPDRDPSLYLDYDSAKGLTLVRCRAGCDFSAVMAELGVPKPAIHDDYLELEEYKELKAAERAGGSDQTARARAARKTSAKSSAPAAKPLGPLPARLLDRKSRPVSDEVLVCYYDYSSAAGELIQRVNRFEYDAAYPQPDGTEVIRRTKTFRQAFPRPTEGWYERTPAGFVPQLYHLPELQERDEEWTWLPEGEKDVERLKEEDQRGTTNVGGADNFKAKKAVGGYVAALAGHRVIIAVDRDLAGYKRAVEVYDLLAPVAAELRIVLPRVEEPHADVSDHLDAGYSLDDLIVVPIEVMRDLYAAAQMASDIAKGAEECQWAAAEAKARAALAAAGQDPEENWAAAARWAAECGKQLDRVVGKRAALSSLPRSAEFCDTADAGVEEARSATRLAYTAAGRDVPAATEARLSDDAPDNVVDLFGDGRSDHLEYHEIPTSTQSQWAYVEDAGHRGVYLGARKVAPLPYVHARIRRRDGSGRQTGIDYLVSAERDSEPLRISYDEIRSNSWTNVLGMTIAQDDKILRNTTTALQLLAAKTELREATPRTSDEGRVELPRSEIMDCGYLRTSDLPRDKALEEWRQVLVHASQNPKFALVLGAAAVAPFISGLRLQPHVVSLFGAAKKGKTTTLRTAAAMWGYPGTKHDAGTMLSWNATKLAVPAFLGGLGVLPAFLDDIGGAGDLKHDEWHQLITNITEGASRMRSARHRAGVELGMQWRGIFFSTGNDQMAKEAAGRNAGIPRRIIEMITPFTQSKAQGAAVDALATAAYGHIGHEIIHRYSTTAVRDIISRRAILELAEIDQSHSHVEAIAEHLTAHVAGAMMLDEICGAGGKLVKAAADAARDFLAECLPPPVDADLVLDELADWIAREPGAWPTHDQHHALKQPWNSEGSNPLPQHGFRGDFAGLVDHEDDGSRLVTLTAGAWKQLVEKTHITPAVALSELYARKQLEVQPSRRKRGEWKNYNSVLKCEVYQIRLLAPEPDDVPAEPADLPPDRDPNPSATDGVGGGVGGPVGGADTALTCNVGGVGGVGGSRVRDAHAREGTSSNTGQSADDAPPDEETGCEAGAVPEDDQEVAMSALIKLPSPVPCTVCRTATRYTVNGVPLHEGECAEAFEATQGSERPGDGEDHQPTVKAPGDLDLVVERLDLEQPRPPCVVCGVGAGQLINGVALHHGPCTSTALAAGTVVEGAPIVASDVSQPEAHTETAAEDEEELTAAATARATASTTAPDTASSSSGASSEPSQESAAIQPTGKPARWRSPVVVVDEKQLTLPGGEQAEWPAEIRHLGDLAMLAHPDQLRLGHGGGETLPQEGQIWVTSMAAMKWLGLPEQLRLPSNIGQMEKRAAKKAMKEALAEHGALPAVELARQDGWQIGAKGGDGDLEVWTYLKHPDLLPGGARIVFMPWMSGKVLASVPLITEADSKTELATNLADFAQSKLGVQFLITPAQTAKRLIDNTRPPRRDEYDISGTNDRRVAVVKHAQSELPPCYRQGHDRRFSGRLPGESPAPGEAYTALEADNSWHRPFTTLPESAQQMSYVHLYDRAKSYLVEWETADFGVEGLVHRVGDDAAWDGREHAGVYLIELDWLDRWPRELPPPPLTARVDGRALVVTMTLKQLAKVGITPTVVESYTWDVHSRYLELAAKRIKAAVDHPNAAVADTAKQLYQAGSGVLAYADGAYGDDALWRPDWYDVIKASARFKIQVTLQKLIEAGVVVLAAGRDSIAIASTEADPVKAWPVRDRKGNPTVGRPSSGKPATASIASLQVATPGMWTPEASGRLADWGPGHLPDKHSPSASWDLVAAVNALTRYKPRRGDNK